MRLFALCLGWVWAACAHAGDIVGVLERSHQLRLHQFEAASADSERAARVRTTFERLLASTASPPEVELRVVTGRLNAEVLLGRVLVVSEAAGDLPEGERLLLLAHELGHVVLGHWQALGALYRTHIPGEVRPETTDPVAAVLGLQAHRLAHRHEFEADAWGYTLLRRLGFGIEHAVALLMRRGATPDTATHPATRRRVAQLRAIDTQLDHPDLASGQAAALVADRDR